MAWPVSSHPGPLTGFQLQVRGKTGEGGVIDLSREGRHDQFLIPGALFNLLAVLMPAASSETDPWASLPAKDLARELTGRGGGDPRRPLYEPKHVIRLVF